MRRGALQSVVVHGILVLAALATIYPVLWVVKMALTPSQSFSMGVSPFPTEVSLDNFRAVLGTTTADGAWLFGRQLFNSLLVSALTAVMGVGIACSAPSVTTIINGKPSQVFVMRFAEKAVVKLANQLTGSRPNRPNSPLIAPNWRWNMPFQISAVM